MDFLERYKQTIFKVTPHSFEKEALKLFHFQAKHNPVYKHYLELLKIIPEKTTNIQDIPFLPITFFKTHSIITGLAGKQAQKTFISSGTSANIPSKHHICDLSLYEQSFTKCFELFYGNIQNYCILALLPSYMERKNASLLYMAEKLIHKSNHPDSGFFLNDTDNLINTIQKLSSEKNTKILLLGVSYALLGLAEKYDLSTPNILVMETGGMKGKRKEMVREQLHTTLCKKLGTETIHSEYGMTELLSQAYAKQDGLFYSPPWMKVMIRELNDPFSIIGTDKTGAINIIDLANIYSCAFIATDDLGKLHQNGSFEVLGRFDNSEIRGCNLLVE